MHSAVNADGDAHQVVEQHRHQRHHNRHRQHRRDGAPHRRFVLEGVAEVKPGQDIAHPFEILHEPGLIQAVAFLQAGQLAFVHDLAFRLQPRHVGGQVVPRRQLDDEENHQRHDQQDGKERQDALEDVIAHRRLPPWLGEWGKDERICYKRFVEFYHSKVDDTMSFP